MKIKDCKDFMVYCPKSFQIWLNEVDWDKNSKSPPPPSTPQKKVIKKNI